MLMPMEETGERVAETSRERLKGRVVLSRFRSISHVNSAFQSPFHFPVSPLVPNPRTNFIERPLPVHPTQSHLPEPPR